MPLNPNIILGVQRPKFTSPQELYAQKAQVEQNELANRLGGMKVRAFEQEQADNQLERGIYSKFGADTAANQNMLMQAGLGKQAFAYGETQAKAAKAKVDTEKAQIEKALKVFEMSGQIMSGVSDQATWDRARQQTAEAFGPEAAAKMPAQYDPALVDQKRNQALSVKEQLEQKWKAAGYDLDVQKFGETKRSNRVSEGISGGNLAIARENLGLRKQELTSGGKAPAGYRFKPDGSLEPIPGGPAAGKAATATEGERKAATLLKRLEGSQAQLNAALQQNPDAAKPGVIASGMRAVGAEALANTTAVGSERQRIEAAQLDMLDAALTLGTGAAYTREQLEGYRKSYFPQIGDTPDNVRDKKARLTNVINAAKIAAGRAGPQGGSSGVTGGWDGGDDPLGLRK